MTPEIAALLSAMGWAGDSILVRKGARTSNIVAAAFFSYCVAVFGFGAYLVANPPPRDLWPRAAVYFVMGGCLQPLLARILFYMGMTRMGVSRAGPLRGAEPLFALALAVIFLRERPNFLVYAGTAVIVTSAWLITSRGSGESRWKLSHIAFPLGAAFFAAVSQNLRKAGLSIWPDPVFGAAVSTSTSLLLFVVFLAASGRIRLIRTNRRSFPFFGSAALVSMTAQFLNFAALNRGEVSAMVPLTNTTPLFSVLFSLFFLRDQEEVSAKVILGAALMVAGVVIIASR